MDKVGILLVSKCLSSSAMVDTFLRSQKYRPEFYVIERQLNPFNHSRAKFHAVVVKPYAPARGAGVGVWGSDFESEEEMSSFFLNVLSKGRVVVERKVEGEESSFHAFSDGKHFHPAPLTRDYKRALDENRGRLTGGMGSYRSKGAGLPFLTYGESERLSEAAEDA